jgi:hypothetical protein
MLVGFQFQITQYICHGKQAQGEEVRNASKRFDVPEDQTLTARGMTLTTYLMFLLVGSTLGLGPECYVPSDSLCYHHRKATLATTAPTHPVNLPHSQGQNPQMTNGSWREAHTDQNQ